MAHKEVCLVQGNKGMQLLEAALGLLSRHVVDVSRSSIIKAVLQFKSYWLGVKMGAVKLSKIDIPQQPRRMWISILQVPEQSKCGYSLELC